MSDPTPIEELFVEAVRQPRERREAFVASCSDDAAVRARVAALVEAYVDAPDSLETAAVQAAAIPTMKHPASEGPGAVIDRYKLLQQIGEGGFGSVWMAEQKEPVKRRVALKIIKLGMDTKQVIARFEAERQALAMMDHPNIARVLDAGTTETGRPYFVMEYVRGVGILEYCDTERLDTEARLDLFVKVCRAIQHAHQKGIIHRDIKPSNVMVTMHDGVPVPKVIDFGVAKATNTELTQKTLFTEHRQMIGTPAYMSPEQAEMSGLDIDTRSDIYALGVLLYELLTGTTPFDSKELASKGFAEMMQFIREHEPHKPSTRLSTLGETATRTADLRRADPGKLGVILRGDLDWIVMKCLEKDRTRRYETANGLAADIARHQREEPVVAGPPGHAYRVQKFLRRNRIGVMTASVVLVAVLLGTAFATTGFIHASRERDRLQASEEKMRLLRQLFGGGQVSLAVLPLESRSHSPEHDYLADALTTTLVEDLSRISALRVMSEDSVRSALRHTGSEPSLRAIASDLKVDGVVTGWVELTDGGVHLTVQLVHALTNQELSERVYKRDLGSLQALEHDVSRDIVSELELELTTQEETRLASARTIDPAAQTAYMKGTRLLRSQTRDELQRALDFFDRAIEIEPDFAAAHAGRARAYTWMENQFAAPLETMPQALQAAERAIELDDSLAAAHDAIGNIHLSFGWDWDAAEASFRRAIELDPDFAEAYVGYATFFSSTGQPSLAMDYLDRAIELDPFVFLGHDGVFFVPYMCGRYARTIQWARSALEFDPRLWEPHTWAGLALAELGRFEEAVAETEAAVAITEEVQPGDSPALAYAALGGVCARASSHAKTRDRASELLQRAKEALAEIDMLRTKRFVCPYETATVHLALGDIDAMYDSLYEAIEVRSACIPGLAGDPRYEGVRADPRFIELVQSDERVADLFRRNGLLPYPSASPTREREPDSG